MESPRTCVTCVTSRVLQTVLPVNDNWLKGSTQSALTLSNVAGIFYILVSGLALSIVVSLGEYLSKKQADHRHNEVYNTSLYYWPAYT